MALCGAIPVILAWFLYRRKPVGHVGGTLITPVSLTLPSFPGIAALLPGVSLLLTRA